MPSASAPDIEPPPDAGAPEPSDGGMSVEPGIDPEPGKLAGITAEHNLLRAMIDHGDPLPPLVWDEDIAAIAQAYAEELAGSCGGLVHSMTPGLGENLAFFGTSSANSMYGSGVESADSWYSEGACYIYAPIGETDCDPSCDEFQQFGTCGHYTQVVWRESERLGCGVASCFDGQLYRDYYVCNYDPPGNYYGQYPY